MVFVWREKTGDASPSASFNLELSENTRVYEMYDDIEERDPKATPAAVSMSVIYDKITELLGTTKTGTNPLARGAPGGAGCIQRLPPACDPAYVSLFCDDVKVSIPQGESYVRKDVNNIGLAIKSADEGFAGYRCVLFSVRYVSRPFAVLPDVRLKMKEGDFWDDDGLLKHFYWYDETLRNCHHFSKAMDSRIQASQASAMRFRVTGNPKTFPGIFNDSPINGIPEMTIDDVGLTLKVYGVPQRFVDSPRSWLRALKGRINQRIWGPGNWEPGSLLYLGFDVDRTYVTPQFDLIFQPNPDQQGSFAAAALVDLSLQFILTNRKLGAQPPLDEVTNKNFIVGGHNAQPCLPAKQYFYASNTLPDKADRVPSYRSHVFEMLLMDPDADLGIDPP